MASTRDWFETVAEAQRRAKRRLPRSVYLVVVAGAESGVTMHDNVRAEAKFGERADVVVHRHAGLGAGHHRQVHRPGQPPLGTALRLGDRLEPISRACHLGVS